MTDWSSTEQIEIINYFNKTRMDIRKKNERLGELNNQLDQIEAMDGSVKKVLFFSKDKEVGVEITDPEIVAAIRAKAEGKLRVTNNELVTEIRKDMTSLTRTKAKKKVVKKKPVKSASK